MGHKVDIINIIAALVLALFTTLALILAFFIYDDATISSSSTLIRLIAPTVLTFMYVLALAQGWSGLIGNNRRRLLWSIVVTVIVCVGLIVLDKNNLLKSLLITNH
jgi:hypothetical protein